MLYVSSHRGSISRENDVKRKIKLWFQDKVMMVDHVWSVYSSEESLCILRDFNRARGISSDDHGETQQWSQES
jgi:hypothetical protein